MRRTQVGIVGGGPAGLLLGELLAAAGIDTVLLEARDRAYAEARIRAGVLEQGSVDLLDQLGLAKRLHEEGLVHRGIYLQFNGERHRIDLAELTGGKTITVYGQQEVVRDLTAARLAAGRELLFDAEVLGLQGVGPTEPGRPTIRFRHHGEEELLECDLVAGCDGSHGRCLSAFPTELISIHERQYPFAWLGALAQVAPSSDELIYSFHDRGFALHSLRSPAISRLYLQVDPHEDLGEWPDQRIWDELHIRLGAPGWTLHEGQILDKSITPMRSSVAEPMRYGKLFLAGDAAHIVPPTGAKGLNLALADVRVLAEAFQRFLQHQDSTGLDRYSQRCLNRVWKAQNFSITMTGLLHLNPEDDAFGRRLQGARQEYIVQSLAASTALAENYVGLPFVDSGADVQSAPA
ncbi:MAG TPA: 4-hydroxybenzoate 3-monooxygenase [Candidatus Dormibacteraeota bacterium]|nr:4-hydroxybenzoate 3-monooxygenase [Candidatus Dormibacteraeota bacterium]